MYHTQAFLDKLPHLIKATGHANFVETCLDAFNSILQIDHFGLFQFSDNLRPRLIGGASLDGENLTVMLARKYIRYFYLSDPNLTFIRDHSNKCESPLLIKLRASDIENPTYRQQIYEHHQLNERLSWLGQCSEIWYAANMYRERSSGNFSEDELAQINNIAPIVVACIEQHINSISSSAWEAGETPSVEWFEELLRELSTSLTPRETQVCARALTGMTRNGIGLDLEIKPTTVSTLIQRAYVKLNISTLSELFALCLRALALHNS
jgi:DNA-binding CsgD family transcriptional regulator